MKELIMNTTVLAVILALMLSIVAIAEAQTVNTQALSPSPFKVGFLALSKLNDIHKINLDIFTS
jgi:hypothetical protein